MPDPNAVLDANAVLFALFLLVGGLVVGFFTGGYTMRLSGKNGWDHPWRKKKD